MKCTQPHLYVVRGGGSKGLHKLWGINFPLWIIATSACGTTPPSIPERITDLNRLIVRYPNPSGFQGSITEVVITDKTRKSWCWIKVWINYSKIFTYYSILRFSPPRPYYSTEGTHFSQRFSHC